MRQQDFQKLNIKNLKKDQPPNKNNLSDSDELVIPEHFEGKAKDEMSQHGFDIKSPAQIQKSKSNHEDPNRSFNKSLKLS